MAEPDDLTSALGRMTVRELAQHVQIGVAQLVLAVLKRRAPSQAPQPRADSSLEAVRPKKAPRRPPRPRKAKQPRSPRSRPREAKQPRSPRSSRPRKTTRRPPTRREIHEAVDRWLLAEAFEEEQGNVTWVAQRLGSPRNRVRERWARVRWLGADAMEVRLALVDVARRPPTKDELRALKSLRAVHAAIDRWLVQGMLELEDGNVSKAAVRLGVSRRLIRALRDRGG